MISGEQDCKGFLISCDKNKEKQAIKDAYNFISEYVEKIYDDLEGQLMKKQLNEQGKQINLQNELKITKKTQNKLLFSLQTKVNCMIFIKINPKYSQIDPHEVVQAIMKDVHENNAEITRFCHKILPVEKCFKAEHFKMLDNIDELFQKRDNSKIRSWALNFKCRNNSKFNYKEILGEIQKITVKYGHFVDIYYPEWTISVQIAHHMMCLSICEKYKQYKEYKLRRKSENKREEEGKNKRERMKDKKEQKQKLYEQVKKEVKKNEGQNEEKMEKNENLQLLNEKIELEDNDEYDII